MRIAKLLVASAFAICPFLSSEVVAQPTFELPLGNVQVISVGGVSGDGNTIVGATSSTGWIWNSTTGVQLIPGGAYGLATPRGISTDGRYIAIQNVRDTAPRRRQSRFDRQTGVHEYVDYYDGNRSVEGFGISPDGGTLPVVVSSGTPPQLGRWNPGQPATWHQTFTTSEIAFGMDASNNGVVVGYKSNGFTNTAFRLTGSNFQYLPPANPNENTTAVAVSADGVIIAGTSARQPVAWINGSILLMPTILSASSFTTNAMATDGSVIGGEVTVSGRGTVAWFWSENTGTVILQDYLAQRGLVVPSLFSVEGVSDDRRVFVGKTTGGVPYRVTLGAALPPIPIPTTGTVAVVLSGATLALRRRRN